MALNQERSEKKMGFFSAIKEAALEANEEAHAVRLEQGLRDTMAGLAGMQEHVRSEALTRFLVKRHKTLPHVPNWSREGCMQMAKTFQAEARKHYNFNLAESYALWMAGAWLEGALRNSTRARYVHEKLEALATDALTDRDIAAEIRRRV